MAIKYRYRLGLAYFWLMLLVLSYAGQYFYIALTDTLWNFLDEVSRPYEFPFNWANALLYIVGAVLLQWRFMKVIVLQGSPFPIGLDTAIGRENAGESGNMITSLWIGNLGEKKDDLRLWYGAIFKAHPNSDKLVRSRLHFLIVAISSDWVLIVRESRLLITSIGHDERATRFNQIVQQFERR